MCHETLHAERSHCCPLVIAEQSQEDPDEEAQADGDQMLQLAADLVESNHTFAVAAKASAGLQHLIKLLKEGRIQNSSTELQQCASALSNM